MPSILEKVYQYWKNYQLRLVLQKIKGLAKSCIYLNIFNIVNINILYLYSILHCIYMCMHVYIINMSVCI